LTHGAAVPYHSPSLSRARGAPSSSGGRDLPFTTPSAKPGTVERRWYVVDAEGQNLGRLASVIAETLSGKRSPWYTRHCDTGDFVVVVNAGRVAVTGKKLRDKLYHRHSGYPGGLRTRTLGEQLARRPEEVIRRAVRGMLPRNSLGRAQLGKLKVYAGPEHPHVAQRPEPLRLSRIVETEGA
jgi:large subunit ribosomal protein L13